MWARPRCSPPAWLTICVTIPQSVGLSLVAEPILVVALKDRSRIRRLAWPVLYCGPEETRFEVALQVHGGKVLVHGLEARLEHRG